MTQTKEQLEARIANISDRLGDSVAGLFYPEMLDNLATDDLGKVLVAFNLVYPNSAGVCSIDNLEEIVKREYPTEEELAELDEIDAGYKQVEQEVNCRLNAGY